MHIIVIMKMLMLVFLNLFVEKDGSVPTSDRRQVLLQKLEGVETENTELKRQLKVAQKRLQDLYERDSQQGEHKLHCRQ